MEIYYHIIKANEIFGPKLFLMHERHYVLFHDKEWSLYIFPSSNMSCNQLILIDGCIICIRSCYNIDNYDVSEVLLNVSINNYSVIHDVSHVSGCKWMPDNPQISASAKSADSDT